VSETLAKVVITVVVFIPLVLFAWAVLDMFRKARRG